MDLKLITLFLQILELDVNVCTTSFWPSSQSKKVRQSKQLKIINRSFLKAVALPAEIAAHADDFVKFYTECAFDIFICFFFRVVSSLSIVCKSRSFHEF